jgi:hypothetical protein
MMGDDLDHSALLDYERSVCLCDAGRPDLAAVTAIGPDGAAVLLVADQNRIGDPTATFDPNCLDAPHEQTGPLPPRWQSRIELAPLYCGRRTLRGTRCRIPVTRPGQACGWHRRAAADNPGGHDREETP